MELAKLSLSVCIDRNAFSKIIDNLIVNAIKYSEKEIVIRVNTSHARCSECFEIEVLNDGDLVSKDEREKIFKAFYSTQSAANKPIMDGLELCNSIKMTLAFSHIPIILLTAQRSQQTHLKGLKEGANAYVEKPFSVDILLAQIENILKEQERMNSLYVDKPFVGLESLSSTALDDVFLKKINEYIENNITDDTLSVEKLSEAMGMSSSSLYRKVKGISGISTNDLIKITRF